MEENISRKRPKEVQAKVLRKVRIAAEENVVRAKEMADLSIKQDLAKRQTKGMGTKKIALVNPVWVISITPSSGINEKRRFMPEDSALETG